MHKNAIKIVWGGQNYGTFWIKKGCAPFCALFGQIMCDFELKTIGNSD